MNIQIVEDDRTLSEGIRMALQESANVFIQNDSIKSAMEAALGEISIDLVILDLNLPDGNGYAYLKWLREQFSMPVLILTANDLEIDEVTGLSLGADDYMTKPFSIAVLRARVHALLRRTGGQETKVYQEDGFFFDFAHLVFKKDNRTLSLSVNEQKLLQLLVANKGSIMTRNLLLERLWQGESDYADENALSVTMNRLRGKLEERTDNITFIQTVYGQGYVWKKTEREKKNV
ncbi:MAG: response regulator transcription factor [Lachnospiraceae bacterium]|nr:response regulator transcription factor [Lachnospiraceae bacterium]